VNELLYAAYGCGNRRYFRRTESAPETCPHDGCDAAKDGVYEAQ
jgi:hypothetical protein